MNPKVVAAIVAGLVALIVAAVTSLATISTIDRRGRIDRELVELNHKLTTFRDLKLVFGLEVI
jgi:hypothetical protein